MLTPAFPKKHVGPAHRHFVKMISDYQIGKWEESISKAGKFIEATLKALGVHAGISVPSGRHFKADKIINDLGQQPTASFSDTIRITIPRACRFIYDIASNRGARHDPDEVDPNEMDATVAVMTSSWILAEMIRYAQKEAVDLNKAGELIRSLVVRRYPLIEEVEGRVYFHHRQKSAPDVALLALAYHHPKRISKGELVATIQRHNFKRANAEQAIRRIRMYVDEDDEGQLRLLAPGLKRAENIMERD